MINTNKNINKPSFRAFRISLGLTQTSLAAYLGMTRTAYIKAEKGLLRFTSPALLKIAALEVAHEKAIEQRKSFPDSLFSIPVKRKEKKRKYKISLLQKKLLAMETAFKTNTRLYITLKKSKGANRQENVWIKSQIQRAINKVQSNNLANQQELKERIYLLESEEIFLTQYRLKNHVQLMDTNHLITI